MYTIRFNRDTRAQSASASDTAFGRPSRLAANAPILAATIALVLAMTGAPSSVLALSTDRDKVLNVEGGYQQTQLGSKTESGVSTTVLTGGVKMDQGSLKAHADKADVSDIKPKNGATDDGSKRIVLTGNPAHMEQRMDNDGGLMTADASKIDYNSGTGIAELTGNVVVIQQGNSEFRGEHMIYNTNTGAMEGGSHEPGAHVHLKFLPKDKTTTPAKPAASTKPAQPSAEPAH